MTPFALRSGLAVVTFFAAALVSLPGVAQQPAAGDVAARRAALNKLLAEQWEYTLKESPEAATIFGDLRYNDRLSDVSLTHIRESNAQDGRWLARFEAVDTAGFPEQEQLNKTLMVRNLKESLEGYKLKLWEMPVNQMSGDPSGRAAAGAADSVRHDEGV